MRRKVVIGITLDYVNDDNGQRYSEFPWYAIRRHYSDIMFQLDCVPIFLPFEAFASDQNVDNILSIIDGLIITGGDSDIPPEFYGEKLKYPLKLAYDRSNYEYQLATNAIQRNMPLLGVCHGMQLINVVMGGDLYQNIEDQIKDSVPHRQKTSRKFASHNLKILEGTKLSKIIGDHSLSINSHHKQAVKNLGKGLKLSAVCPEDGVIEAFESELHDFVLGIEWHPEITCTDQEKRIFKSFANAAQMYNAEQKVS